MFHSSADKKFKCLSSWGVCLMWGLHDFESGHIHLNGNCSTRAWPPVGRDLAQRKKYQINQYPFIPVWMLVARNLLQIFLNNKNLLYFITLNLESIFFIILTRGGMHDHVFIYIYSMYHWIEKYILIYILFRCKDTYLYTVQYYCQHAVALNRSKHAWFIE